MSVTFRYIDECNAHLTDRWDVSIDKCQPENSFVDDEEMSQKKGFVCLMCVTF